MATINAAVTTFFDLVFAPAALSPWLGLVIVSLLTGGVLLLVFRYTSNQRAIKRTKDQIVGHLLEVVLYRDELRVVLRAQARLFKDNLRYLGNALVPLCFMIIPVAFFLVQTDLRFGHRPLQVGETAILSVKLAPEAGDLNALSISPPAGIELDSPPLRIPARREVDCRIRAVAPGAHDLQLIINDRDFTKRVVVGAGSQRVSTARVGSSLWAQFLHPGEPPVPSGVPVTSVAISYPDASLRLFGWRLHWVWPWLILSMAFGYALKGPLRVQV